VIAFVALAGTAQAKDLSPGKIIDRLNAERAELGMPAVKLSSTYSKGCKLHNRWEQLNNAIGHDERPGTRGYTKLGDKTAGLADLAFGTGGWARRNPWANGPFHLMLIDSPNLRSAGAYDSYNRSCLETQAGVAPPPERADDQFWTMPADGGKAPYLQWALESPYVPQELIGISARKKTGPNILVWTQSVYDRDAGYHPLERVVSASLVQAGGGSVAVGAIDRKHSKGSLGEGNFVIVPKKPLKKRTAYEATIVVATDEGRQATHTWSFKTTSSRLDG
jgi:hypothetical protein